MPIAAQSPQVTAANLGCSACQLSIRARSASQPQQCKLQRPHALMFPVVNLRVAKTIQSSFQFLFNDGGVNHGLVPKRGMVTFKVSYQLILSLKDLLADETHLRQQLSDVVMAQQIAASLIVHCLHHQTVCIQLSITWSCSPTWMAEWKFRRCCSSPCLVKKTLLQMRQGKADVVLDVVIGAGCPW